LASTGTAVLALDFGATKLAVGVGHADGEMTRVETAPTNAADGAEAALARALELADAVYQDELAGGGAIEAIGVASMGYTHATHVELAPNVPGWNALRIPEAIARSFPDLPVTVGNDVHLAAQAEILWGSLRDVSDGIYLNLGSGVSAGIICNGQLLSGANGVAGEVGYSLLRGGPEERMAADGATPFEDYFGGAGAARRLAGTDLPGSVAELVELTELDDADPEAKAFVDELWTGIAVLAVNLCTALNPSVLSLGGGYVRGNAGVLDRVSELVGRAVPYPPEVVRAQFGGDASLRGAVASALTLTGVVR
jgi:glucokinase